MLRPSWLEVNFFLLLLAASLYSFWLRFGPILNNIRRAKKDPGFQLRPAGRRVLNWIWEVALQGKVIRERPLAGLAHAFVFWGFCAFALVSLDHLAAGFGADVLPEHSLLGRFYFSLAALFAVLVFVSITVLAIRRFIARPWYFGAVSAESGIIAFLIATLMATYLIDYLHVAPEGTALGRLNWWIHTLALLTFVPLIPHTKHLHLLLSPVTVFFRRGGFSSIPPLAGDEDFGLVNGKDMTQIGALQAYSCVECGRCTQHCPATNTGKELNPKEVILGLRNYLNENGTASEVAYLGATNSMEAVFQCTTCGACEFQCPVGIEHLPLIIGLRRGAVNTGAWDDEQGGKLFLNLERYGNAMGFPSSERDKFIQKNDIPYFDGSQEYCLWMGCMGSYDPQGREIVLSLVEVMRHLGVSFGVLKKERCSGDPARRLGNDLAFQQLVEQNKEQMDSAKVQKLVSICPHCVRTIGTDWAELGAAMPIEHHSEFLARFCDQLPKADPHSGEKIVFHDPCYLGRYRGVYDEPRQVAALGGKVVEAPRSHERSFCCGAGGGLVFLGEEQGKRVNVARAGQAGERRPCGRAVGDGSERGGRGLPVL
ncbi:MAG: (Fe-S)-binding protein [Acidobacteria bacterium]|nr:(Fe-S)-binding protein [Acidobacteriota bacterium]